VDLGAILPRSDKLNDPPGSLAQRPFDGPKDHALASEKRLVPYSYAAARFFLRLPSETATSEGTVSVQPFRYESRTVIAGLPSFVPMALHDSPSSSRRQTTSSRWEMRKICPGGDAYGIVP